MTCGRARKAYLASSLRGYPMPAVSAPRRWYHDPTVIIAAGCMVAVISFGARASMGLFTHPISEYYHWDREIYGLAMALQNLVWGIFQPIAGAFADRYGPARVIATGAVVYALGLALMSISGTPALLYLSGGLLAGIGIATASFSIVMAGFGRLVPPEKRSWSFGLATAAGSLGQFIFAPLGQGFIAAFGWQTALVVLAVPLSAPAASSSAVLRTDERAQSMREAVFAALGHRSFILLVSGFFVCGFQLAFATIHLPAYLVEH